MIKEIRIREINFSYSYFKYILFLRITKKGDQKWRS